MYVDHTDKCCAVRKLLRVDASELDVLNVEQLLDCLVIDHDVSNVRRHNEIGCRESFACEHLDHGADVCEDLCAGCVPLGCRHVLRVVCSVIELDSVLLVLTTEVVGVLLEHVAIVEHSLGCHVFLAAVDQCAELLEIQAEDLGLSLLWSDLAVKVLTEALFVEVVDGERSLRCYEWRHVLHGLVALACDIDAALSRHYNRRDLLISVSVLDEHFLSRENVSRRSARKVAVTQEGAV